jgi:8-oxo-dGTP diphosphatase
MKRFGCVILVDRRGWVLLQERDEHPAIDPEKWSLCGGHLEEGEEFLDGALRELAEETGVELTPAELELFHHLDLRELGHEHPGAMAVYAAATDLTDDDIVLGEGRQIVFVEPDAVATLDLSDSAARIVPSFLESDLYRKLRP